MKVANEAFDECSEEKKYWIDFFTLRQCASKAFNVEEMVEVIAEIGITVVELDGDFVGDLNIGGGKQVLAAAKAKKCTYLSRAFCIFEVCVKPCPTPGHALG